MGWVGEDKRDVFNEVSKETREEFFNHRDSLRKKLFFLGESALIPGTIYSWEQLKVEYPSVSDIGFLTPFQWFWKYLVWRAFSCHKTSR
jgi:hypothetical protein